MSATPGPTRPQGPEQQFTVPLPDAPTNPYAGQPARPALAQSRCPLTSLVVEDPHRRHRRPARAAVTPSR